MRWPPRRRWRRPTRGSSRSSCARRTRTWPSACEATAWFSSIGARASCATRRRCGRSSASPPASIPDWLALAGDSADGYPGLPGWGAKSAATVLARYRHLEHIPRLAGDWDVPVRGALRLATTLAEQRDRALLFRELATLRADAPIGADVDALRWTGPPPEFGAWSERLGTPSLQARAVALAAARAHT